MNEIDGQPAHSKKFETTDEHGWTQIHEQAVGKYGFYFVDLDPKSLRGGAERPRAMAREFRRPGADHTFA